jgi:hypothetical protein
MERQVRADGKRCDTDEVGRLADPNGTRQRAVGPGDRRSVDRGIHDGDAKAIGGPARGLLHPTSGCIQELLTIMGCPREGQTKARPDRKFEKLTRTVAWG